MPIGKLLVFVNQPFSGYLINAKQMSNKAKNQIGIPHEIKLKETYSQIVRRSSCIFKENHVFIEEEDKPLRQSCYS